MKKLNIDTKKHMGLFQERRARDKSPAQPKIQPCRMRAPDEKDRSQI